jgi:hypothetical protein
MKLPIASATKEGILSTGAQTIAGDKTFTGSLIHAGGINRFSRADSTPTGTANNVFDDIVIGSVETTNTGITIFGSGQVGIAFGDAADSIQGQIRFQHSTNTMEFGTTSANPAMLRIDSNGRVGIGTAPVTGVALAVHHSSDHSYIQARALSASYAGVVEARNSDNKTLQLINYSSGSAGSLLGVAAANSSYVVSDSTTHLAIGTTVGTPLVFSTSNAERMRIDSSGNVGIGVNSPVNELHVHSSAITSGIRLTSGFTGSTNSDGSSLVLYNSDLYINNRESGALIFEVNGAERMRINSSGNIGVGTTSPNGKIHINDGSVVANTICNLQGLIVNANSVTKHGLYVEGGITSGAPTGGDYYGVTVAVNNSGGSGGARVVTGNLTQITGNGSSSGDFTRAAYWNLNNSTTCEGVRMLYGQIFNNTSHFFIHCSEGGNDRFQVRSNGGIGNFQANNVNFSDERIKTNIENYTDNILSLVTQLEIKKFKYYDSPSSALHIGLIAQQVQEHMPFLITNLGNNQLDKNGDTIDPLMIKTHDLTHIMLKAIQEQNALITVLQARIDGYGIP